MEGNVVPGLQGEELSLVVQSVELRIATAPQVNFACHQNAVPVIREIELVNPGIGTLHNLTLEMRSSPAFIAPKNWHIDRLLSDGTLHINDRDTRLNGEYLLNLLEQQRGELTFRLLASDGELLTECTKDVELLARNEWGGYLVSNGAPSWRCAWC